MGTTTQKLARLKETKKQIMKGIKDIGGNIANNTTFREGVQEIANVYDYYNNTSTTIPSQPATTKTDYLKETKREYKEVINLFEQNITNNTPFNEYSTHINNIYDNLPKTTKEGTNITFDSGKQGLIKINSLIGNTFQQQYEGKNLFNKNNYPVLNGYISSGNVITEMQNYQTTYIKCQPNTTYTITKNAPSPLRVAYSNMEIPTLNSSTFGYKRNVNTDNQELTITTGSDAQTLLVTYKEQGYVLGDNIETLQIEQGSTATSYEPYVGEIPAPNPEYPQNIKVVTGNNSIGITGKNLMNYNNSNFTVTDTSWHFLDGALGAYGSNIGTKTNIKTPVTNGTTYTISFNQKTDVLGCVLVYENENTAASIPDSTIAGQKTRTFTANRDGYVILRVRQATGEKVQIENIQIEEGSTATSYEPYITPVELPLNLGNIELYDKDILQKRFENWEKKKLILKIVFNGQEKWIRSSTSKTGIYRLRNQTYKSLLKKPSTNNEKANIFSDEYLVNSAGDNYHCNIGISIDTAGEILIYNKNYNNSNNVSLWTAALAKEPLTVYAELEEPIYEQITNIDLISQLEAINNLYSTNDTIIITTEGNLPIIINASVLDKNS